MDTDHNRPPANTPGLRPRGPAETRPAVAPHDADSEPLPVAQGVGPGAGTKRITAFGKGKRHEDSWNRTPNTTGLGAVHVKTFHGKLTDDAINYMDQCINEWLDSHPQYEVKFVTSTVGMLTGKIQEPHLICQVWV